MAPEKDGKPAPASRRIARTDVLVDDLVDIEQYLVKMSAQMEDICSSDIMSDLSDGRDSMKMEQDIERDSKLEVVHMLASKQDNLKILNELVLLKVRNLIPRQKEAQEDVNSSMNLKRSRPLSPLEVPKVPSFCGLLEPECGAVVPSGPYSPPTKYNSVLDFPTPQAQALPLKYIRTGDNTKAPFQKPATLYMPTAKLGSVGVPILDVAIGPTPTEPVSASVPPVPVPVPLVNAGKPPTPKKRPSRSRRERNRTKPKVVEMPEPVMQKLRAGENSKIPDDGYLWRKYGNKPIKTASFKRGYYKCRHFKEVKCNAQKIVQQMDSDPSTFAVSYKGKHTCSQGSNGLNGAPLGMLESTSLADQVETLDMSEMESPREEKDSLNGLADWPAEDESDSASEDVVPSTEVGEELSTVEIESVKEEHVQPPASPLINFDMPSVESMAADSMTPTDYCSDITIDAASPWAETFSSGGDFKLKYSDACPPEPCSQEVDQNAVLLDFISGNLNSENVSVNDIAYWYDDFGF